MSVVTARGPAPVSSRSRSSLSSRWTCSSNRCSRSRWTDGSEDNADDFMLQLIIPVTALGCDAGRRAAPEIRNPKHGPLAGSTKSEARAVEPAQPDNPKRLGNGKEAMSKGASFGLCGHPFRHFLLGFRIFF